MKTCFVLTVLFLSALTASGQNNRSFVSTAGSDANSCAAGSECRSFTRAIAQTNSGGEVVALTSGGYGTFAVSKPLTIMASPGVTASITVTSGDGIDVTAGSSDSVILRGININAPVAAGVATALSATGYGKLSIQGCTINGGNVGIVISGPPSSTATVTDTVVTRSNTIGISVGTSVLIRRSRVEQTSGRGLSMQFGTNDAIVSVDDFVSAYNSSDGIYAIAAVSGHGGVVSIHRAVVSDNGNSGITADGTGPGGVILNVSDSMINSNASYGLVQKGTAYFGSTGNNFAVMNGGDQTFGTISATAMY